MSRTICKKVIFFRSSCSVLFILEDMPPIELSDGHQVYIAIFKFLSAFFTVGNTYLDNILLCGEQYYILLGLKS